MTDTPKPATTIHKLIYDRAEVTANIESHAIGTWIDSTSFNGDLKSARVEDGKLVIEAVARDVLLRVTLPASTQFEPTTKTVDGLTLTESRPLYLQQIGRAARPPVEQPVTFICESEILTGGLDPDAPSLPVAARAFLKAFDAFEAEAAERSYRDRRDKLAAALVDLRAAVAQVIPE